MSGPNFMLIHLVDISLKTRTVNLMVELEEVIRINSLGTMDI